MGISNQRRIDFGRTVLDRPKEHAIFLSASGVFYVKRPIGAPVLFNRVSPPVWADAREPRCVAAVAAALRSELCARRM